MKPVRIWVDNAGLVAIWGKGYSYYCRLCTTLVKAISVVAAGMGCRVNLEKITRCTTGGAVMADHISKAEFHECFRAGRRMGLEMVAAPGAIPEALLK